jgi:hypothetical protein
MAVTAFLYTSAVENAFKGLIDDISAGSDLKLALLDSGHTPSQDGHTSWDDVNGDEISAGGGYTAGGMAVSGKSLSSASGVTTFDASNIVWSDSTITASYAVLYDDGPTGDTNKKLIGLIDFDGSRESVDGDFTINVHNDGVFTFDVS